MRRLTQAMLGTHQNRVNNEDVEYNLLQSPKDLKLGWRCTFQEDNDPKTLALKL